MSLFRKVTQPFVAPNPKAVEQSQVVLWMELDGTRQNYQGEALQWDIGKARSIALVFASHWYTKRTMHMLLWSTAPAKVHVSSPSMSTAVQVDLEARQSVAAKRLTLEVSEARDSASDEIRVYLTCDGSGGEIVFIGLDGGKPGMSTQLESNVVPDLSLAVLVATWSLVFSALFAVGVQTGSKGALFAAPALAILPGILSLLGVSWAKAFNVSRLARWARSRLPRWGALTWALAGLAAAVLLSHVAAAVLVYSIYYYRVGAQGLSEDSDLQKMAALFCSYPERLEVRALTARKLYEIGRASTFVNAQAELTKILPTSNFLQDCLAARRFTPLFYDISPSEREHALVFYASIWWNSIEKVKDFEPAMLEIRKTFAASESHSDLVALSLAKYEARAIKNSNEHKYCKGEHLAASEDCISRRGQCAVARAKLVALIDKIKAPADVRTVAYLEARDVAASSYMSSGCAVEGPDDAQKAVDHLWGLIHSIPTQEVVLDDLLAQINFRKYLDSQFEKRPGHPTSQEWQEGCKQDRPEVCKLLYETFINDQKQTFFSPDREKRKAEWESASIPALNGVALEGAIERLVKKGWRWPL